MAEQTTDWPAVIGRALARFALDAGPVKDKSIGDRARFLVALGLPRDDVAAMLNTSGESIRVLLAQKSAKKKKAKKNGKKK